MAHSAEQEPRPAAVSESPPANVSGDLSGRTLDDYRLLRCLGSGGMGQVYLAEQISLKRRVALKILKAELAADPIALERFKREAEAVARVTHANIVQVYQIGSADGVHYMALEYVVGRNLREFVARKGPPDAALAIGIMRQVAAALQRAGELGIIHRDIKPENILLTRKGEVKVADFGLSVALPSDQPAIKLTQSGITMGTPLYMSPEQVEGRPLDPRTDIYSFGVTCYHMLCGQPPFRGQTAFEVALQHVRKEPEPLAPLRPDLPPELCAMIHKMMAKKPEERYQTCRELLADLARVREALKKSQPGAAVTGPLGVSGPSAATLSETGHHGSDAGKRTGPVPRVATGAMPVRPRRRRMPWLVAGSILLAATGGAAIGWMRSHAQARSAAVPTGVEAIERPSSAEAERERRMVANVQQYLKPNLAGEDAPQVRLALDHSLELAFFYLERWRLTEADELFGKLTATGNEGKKVPQYQRLGKLGHAIVLALQDKPAESNKLFVEAVGDPERFLQVPWVRLNPKLQVWIARALDHNAANAPNQFPAQLRPLQAPPSAGKK